MATTKTLFLTGVVDEAMYEKVLGATIGKSDDLLLIINSGGGTDAEGLAIYELLRLHPGRVTGMVVGYCYSAATLILAACDHRICTKHSAFLYHFGGQEYANAQEIAAQLRRERTWNALIAERSGQPLAKVVKWHRGETYFDAQQSFELNLVDEVL